MKFEENYTLLKDLKYGDIFISKNETKTIYLKNLGNDKHLLKDFDNKNVYEVPHGNFPIFKQKI